jgi:7-cyano-7-deazaguanine synthase
MHKAFVLLSGGLDSTTCLHKAIVDYFPENPGASLGYGDKDLVREALRDGKQGDAEIPWVEAVSVNYGQRHSKEMDYASYTCDRLGIDHTILDVGALLSGRNVMLSKDSVGSVDIPDISYDDIEGVSPTYVPFRNGLLLSAITAHAQKWVNGAIEERTIALNSRGPTEGKPHHGAHGIELARKTAMEQVSAGVYFGAHAEDAHNWAYPDCTPEFIGAMANAIYIGSYRAIRLHTPLQWLQKHEIVTLGSSLGVQFRDTWSCYAGGETHCGVCPTCRSRKGAFKHAGVKDPTEYAE